MGDQIRQEMGRFELGQFVELGSAGKEKSSGQKVAYAGMSKKDNYLFVQSREESASGETLLDICYVLLPRILEADSKRSIIYSAGLQSLFIGKDSPDYEPASRALNLCRANQTARRLNTGVKS